MASVFIKIFNLSLTFSSVTRLGFLKLNIIFNILLRCSLLIPTANGIGMIPPKIAAQKVTRNFTLDFVQIISSSPGFIPFDCRYPRQYSAFSQKSLNEIDCSVELTSIKLI